MGTEKKVTKEGPESRSDHKELEKKLNDCSDQIKKVNEKLDESRKAKHNTMPHCDSKKPKCGCDSESSGNLPGTKTDLVILIDTSGSMTRSATAISNAITKAIDNAKKECEPDLRITFLGVDGTWSGTSFTQSHRTYITGIHGIVPLQADINHVGLRSEQGANAIEDLSKYYDWREEACRAIFYISDEELDSVSPRDDFANETTVTNAAIVSANSNNVTVFAHHLTYHNRDPQILQNYRDLCNNTGGEVYFSNAPSEDEYIKLLSEVICNSCGKSICKDVEIPKIEPCITIKWGDSDCDCLESTDVEVMTITICNCYSNIKFNNYIISSLEVFDSTGTPVALLPNGTPSVKLHPLGVYCFGDIEPCSCVTREFVMITEGAKEGKYKLVLKGICFDVTIPNNTESSCFEFEICKD